MKLGLINSAWLGSPVGTEEGIRKTKQIGFDTIDIFADPLEVDVYWSMRSPYSYLALNRLVWLNSNYNVNVNIRPVLPVAVRSTKGGSGKAGGLFSLPYKVPDSAWRFSNLASALAI